jgi:membrane protein
MVSSVQADHPAAPEGTYWSRACSSFFTILRRVVQGFFGHNCLIGASALSYSTILSFLPLTALVLVVFSSFPMLAEAKDRFLSILLANFAPQVGDNAAQWFEFAAANATKTTAIGIVAFVFTSFMLLATIEDQLDTIWDVETQRSWGQRIMAYWLVLTLGPLLLGAALTLSSYMASFVGTGGPHGAAQPATPRWLSGLTVFLPALLEFVSLGFLYCVIPNTHVRWRDGIAGAVCAALMLEGLKWAFGLYILEISSYNMIYGAVAGVPIFLLWMYVFWLVVLIGAEIAAALSPRWSVEEAPHSAKLALRAELAMNLLTALAANRDRGGSLSLYDLSQRVKSSPALTREHLGRLLDKGFVAAASDGGWVLARDLSSLNLGQLYDALQIDKPADKAPFRLRSQGR